MNILAAFASVECFCGKPKEPGNAFCGVCYHMLPRDSQRGLWRRIGAGFEETYAAAKAWLIEQGRGAR